ncbi:hypothetical protein scyTo_0019830 [Scyliorhinus torazame]|uniref:Uncharacterized protein n=1 Tax=Scyliorhinus torazame TaxID=75743 RepID=A0A401PS95_SCYTO|nr:hypothetical protein [Scyliorhinus torazame]
MVRSMDIGNGMNHGTQKWNEERKMGMKMEWNLEHGNGMNDRKWKSMMENGDGINDATEGMIENGNEINAGKREWNEG